MELIPIKQAKNLFYQGSAQGAQRRSGWSKATSNPAPATNNQGPQCAACFVFVDDDKWRCDGCLSRLNVDASSYKEGNQP